MTQYLTAEAIESIFKLVLSISSNERGLPHGSEIVFEFIVPDDLMPADEADVFAALASIADELGEHWLTSLRPAELKSRLTALGFSQVDHLSPQDCFEIDWSKSQDSGNPHFGGLSRRSRFHSREAG